MATNRFAYLHFSLLNFFFIFIEFRVSFVGITVAVAATVTVTDTVADDGVDVC